MLPLVAAAAALAIAPWSAPSPAPGAVAQARATVRIVLGVKLRLGEGPLGGGDAPPAQDTIIHPDGRDHPARLIEFQ